ncbi:MAG: hypothetical protein J1F42_05295 [Lachnospiraceae bacterium]|nr:hypothetical protein [Lachnospiraceae bacterium]
MSDRGSNRRGGYVKLFIILGSFVCASPFIGLLIDVFIIFPPSSDAQGHGIPVFTILLPLLAIIVAVVATIVFVVTDMSVKASARRLPGGNYNGSLRYEYIKMFQQCDDAQAPAMILHEVDTNAGRCSVRCIYIYPNGYVENFVNKGVYVPVPTAEAIQVAGASRGQSAHIITGGEFESVWNIGQHAKA